MKINCSFWSDLHWVRSQWDVDQRLPGTYFNLHSPFTLSDTEAWFSAGHSETQNKIYFPVSLSFVWPMIYVLKWFVELLKRSWLTGRASLFLLPSVHILYVLAGASAAIKDHHMMTLKNDGMKGKAGAPSDVREPPSRPGLLSLAFSIWKRKLFIMLFPTFGLNYMPSDKHLAKPEA